MLEAEAKTQLRQYVNLLFSYSTLFQNGSATSNHLLVGHKLAQLVSARTRLLGTEEVLPGAEPWAHFAP